MYEHLIRYFAATVVQIRRGSTHANGHEKFILYKIIEIVLLPAGIALTFFFRQNNLFYAVGIGLIVQSALMLGMALFAEKRGDEYLAAIWQLL